MHLLQDFTNENDIFDISYIKCKDGKLEIIRENDGKIWQASSNGIRSI